MLIMQLMDQANEKFEEHTRALLVVELYWVESFARV